MRERVSLIAPALDNTIRKMMTIIRDATKNDLNTIFDIEQDSYPREQQLPSQECLEQRLILFGIRVAEYDGKIVGFYTCIPVTLNWKNDSIDEETIQRICKNRHPNYTPWFEEYNPHTKYNTLFVTSTAVTPSYQGQGIGKVLVKHSLDFAKQHSLQYRASVLRPSKIKLYQSLNFWFGPTIENYSLDFQNNNIGIFAFKKII